MTSNSATPVIAADTPTEIVAQQPEVHRASIRIPPFWPTEPEMWFWQVEKQFSIGGITRDQTKFDYVISNLDLRYLSEVRDMMHRSPPTAKYETLKTELIRRLGSPQEQKTKRVLEHEEMGDRKPSQFLRHLQALAGLDVPEHLVRSLWMGRLPSSVQAILATQSKSDTATVAELADAVFDALPRQHVMAATPVKTGIDATIEEMSHTITSLNNKITQVQHEIAEIRRRDRSHSRSRSAARESTRSTSSGRGDLCWYHFKFGNNARKCRSPCSRRPENSTGSR